MGTYRKESDVLGSVRVPGSAYYGSETQRAVDNFPISGIMVDKGFIHSYVMLKRAAAIANLATGKLDGRTGKAIIRACDELLAGKFLDQFVVDVFQAGAGTSVNMNVNEVLANRAIELLGGRRGDYKRVHPNDHVNMSQSTNDTYHATIHISAHIAIDNELLPALFGLSSALHKKAREFSSIVKVGRTHLQDAVPMTLGQEFSGYAKSVDEVTAALGAASSKLLVIPLGGTAIGTGLNASKAYASRVVVELQKMTKEKFRLAPNNFAAQSSQREELAASDALKEVAVALDKIANDFRILTSGPRAGIHELILPEVQPGSSIMPGKINPSMAEMLNMVCFQVMGANAIIERAADSGQLELNVFMPVITFNLLFSIRILTNAVGAFTKKCVNGVKANKDAIREHLERDLSIVTALSPYVGYARAAQLARIAYKKNKNIKQVAMELKILDGPTLDKILDPKGQV